MTVEIKQILLNLLKDIPDDVVLMRFMSGVFTCKECKEDLESENSKLFFNNLLRVSRDILIRKANKHETNIINSNNIN